MTEIEKKALALVNEVQKVRGHTGSPWNSPAILNEALYRAIEQHEALEAENERLRGALNPTNRRQAEYMNLFHWSEPDFDECGGRTMRHVSMPWPKIKQALAAIYTRAALEARHD